MAHAKYAQDLSGDGARLYGGRWNNKGTGLIYTAASRSLAAFEALVHMSQPDFLIGRKLVSIGIPKTVTPKRIDLSELPKEWNKNPPPFALAELGTVWAVGMTSLLLQVPSAVVQQEFNILINPQHPDMKFVKIIDVEDFKYDDRLNPPAK
jgi:RES domain-containing protein